MIFATVLFFASVIGLSQTSSVQLQPAPCAQVMADAVADSAVSEICAGDEVSRVAAAAAKDSTVRSRALEAAVMHYRRAATIASTPKVKLLALNVLAGAYDPQHLDEPKQMEAVLREIIAITPDDVAPMFRLAKVLEDEGLVSGAEATLLDARNRQPDAIEPYRLLTQFFARRVTALHKQAAQNTPQEPASSPGEPDANGVYRVGGPIAPPPRDDVPRFPPEAQAAGVKGVVIAEVVIDTSGVVTDAKVVQSIPLLDEEALRAVRNWHFAPTMVNGRPVPVRMNVTVNFSLPATAPPPTPPR